MLLDSHALIWAAHDETLLSLEAHRLIISNSVEVLVSPASYWELSIKQSIGKISAPWTAFEALLAEGLYRWLPITPAHCDRVRMLPHHHRDPFDRMLIAQALSDEVSIISRDQQLDPYGVRRIW